MEYHRDLGKRHLQIQGEETWNGKKTKSKEVNISASARLMEITSNGAWLLPDALKDSFPVCYHSIKNTMLSVDIPDQITWHNQPTCTSISIKEGYFLISLRWIGTRKSGLKDPPLITVFTVGSLVWKDLKISDKLNARGLGSVMVCPLCNNAMESHPHLFSNVRTLCSF